MAIDFESYLLGASSGGNGGGGSSVQPDWNTNDSTADTYIKNRPFYEEITTSPSITFPTDWEAYPYGQEGQYIQIISGSDLGLEVGKSYTIQYVDDTTTYTSTGNCITNSDLGFNTPFLGFWEDTFSFFIWDHTVVNGDIPSQGDGYLISVITPDISLVPQITLLGEETSTIHKINPKFLPNATFSTDEQEIGTWIDGSKIYQKTITTTISSKVEETEVFIADTSIDKFINIQGILDDNSLQIPSGGIIWTEEAEVASFTIVGMKPDMLLIEMYDNDVIQYPATVYITFQYTKTS